MLTGGQGFFGQSGASLDASISIKNFQQSDPNRWEIGEKREIANALVCQVVSHNLSP